MNIETTEINQRDSNGFRQGYWKYYYDGSLLVEGNFVNNLRQGYWKIYCTEGNFVNDLRYGLWKCYYNNRNLFKLGYLNEFQEGEEIVYGY